MKRTVIFLLVFANVVLAGCATLADPQSHCDFGQALCLGFAASRFAHEVEACKELEKDERLECLENAKDIMLGEKQKCDSEYRACLEGE